MGTRRGPERSAWSWWSLFRKPSVWYHFSSLILYYLWDVWVIRSPQIPSDPLRSPQILSQGHGLCSHVFVQHHLHLVVMVAFPHASVFVSSTSLVFADSPPMTSVKSLTSCRGGSTTWSHGWSASPQLSVEDPFQTFSSAKVWEAVRIQSAAVWCVSL